MEEHTNSSTGTYVFLFDADNDAFEVDYGFPCTKMIFDAVLNLPQSVHARVYTGDMILLQFCLRISTVQKSSTQSSTQLHVDHDLYISLLTELVCSIKEQENIFTTADIAPVLGKRNIFAFTFSGLVSDPWKSICQELTGMVGFVGSFQLDMGNPLHTELFLHSLIPHGFLFGNKLFLMRSFFDDEEDLIPYWALEQPRIQVHFLDSEKYENQCPPMHHTEEISSAGMRYMELLRKKGKPDPYQRLAMALLNNDSVSNCDFSISSPFSWEHVDIPEEKFTEYALNLEHKGSGKAKAELFQKLLNITKEDWRYLAAQIENAMESGSLCNVRQTEYGVQFHIDIPIKGLNNASRIVRTAWIIRQPQKCSLVSAYILDQSRQNGSEGQSPLVVQATNPELFCSVLYAYASGAGEQASKNCIPTPMYISGYEDPILEGLVGFAYVVIHDARRRFPKWLKKQGIGHLGYRGGWIVHAKSHSQSFEKAKAYANAFAKVLRQNGIDCDVYSRLD